MKRKIIPLLLIVCLIVTNFFTIECHAAPADNKKKTEKEEYPWPGYKGGLASECAILMEVSTGTVLYEKNSRKQSYPASITKIMTSLLCLENTSLNETVTFSKDAVFGIERNSSNLWIDVGEQLTMEESLYGIMLESANEICLGVAEHIAGDVSSFADMMNERARQLGCKDTHFVNPNGLHDDNHYTSAYDMALIAKEAIKNPAFRKITGTKRYTIPATNKNDVRYLRNHNQIVNGYKHPKYQMDYAIGGKTGYTTKAGNTLVTYAEKDGMDLVCVVMRSKSPESSPNANEYTDTIDLFDFGFGNFKLYDSAAMESPSDDTEDSILFTRFSPLFNESFAPINYSTSANVILPKSVDYEKVVKNVTVNPNPDYNSDNTIIGSVAYTYGERQVGGSDIIYTKSNMPRLLTGKPVEVIEEESIPDPETKKDLKPFIIIGIILFIVLLLFLFYALVYLPRKRAQFSLYHRRKRSRSNYGKDLTDFKP